VSHGEVDDSTPDDGLFTMLPDWLARRADVSPGAKLVWAGLERIRLMAEGRAETHAEARAKNSGRALTDADRKAARDTAEVHVKVPTIAARYGLCERQTLRYLADLEALKLVKVERRKGRTSLYRPMTDEGPVTDPSPLHDASPHHGRIRHHTGDASVIAPVTDPAHEDTSQETFQKKEEEETARDAARAFLSCLSTSGHVRPRATDPQLDALGRVIEMHNLAFEDAEQVVEYVGPRKGDGRLAKWLRKEQRDVGAFIDGNADMLIDLCGEACEWLRKHAKPDPVSKRPANAARPATPGQARAVREALARTKPGEPVVVSAVLAEVAKQGGVSASFADDGGPDAFEELLAERAKQNERDRAFNDTRKAGGAR
jgi:hypothetical protein